ncbi:hypothetical protein PVAP13_7KG021254 [Panicum virgatum]|uniref:Uncharacterized protein n=1 Tax=Panicum virgatum TaxID=38727 RepID=A0A8T0QJN7_PANVG|nr:hypothetical protein PVAP13_7KG021254 [Panicum virgatum]
MPRLFSSTLRPLPLLSPPLLSTLTTSEIFVLGIGGPNFHVPSSVLIPYPLSQFRVLLLEFWGGSWIPFVLPFFLSAGAGGPFGIRSRAPCGARGAQAIGEAGTRPVKRRQPGRAAGACGGSALWRSAQASGSRAAALGNVARDPRPGGQVSRRWHSRLCISELRSARLARVGSSRRRLWLRLLLRRR